jgi:transcription-repair coupling factor (superfamily II helicase)
LIAAEPTLWQPLYEAPLFGELERRLGADERGLCLSGLVAGSRALVVALAVARTGRPALLVAQDDAAIEAWHRDLAAFAPLTGLDPRRILVFPALDADPYDAIAAHPEVVRERVTALGRLPRGEVDILLVPARGLLQPLPPPPVWAGWTRRVRKDDILPPERFVMESLGLGYRRVDIVSAPGEISRRGGIVDIFPPTASEPVRIELFGDAIESLRSFDTDHQRSTGRLEEIEIGPAMENPPTDEAVRRMSAYLEGVLSRTDGEKRATRQLREMLDQMENRGYWPGFEALASMIHERPALLFEHAPGAALIVDEHELAEHELARAVRDLSASRVGSGDRVLPPPGELLADPRRVLDRLAEADLFLQELEGDPPDAAVETRHLASRSARSYAGRIVDLVEDLRASRERGLRTCCLMRAPGSADRLMEILGEYDLPAARWESATPAERRGWQAGGLFVAVGGLRTGFELPDPGLVVLAERDLFGEERKSPDRKSRGRAAFISDFRDLKPADFVVHVDHGIARFTGLGRPKGGSLNRDFMVLEFARGDRLFVPADRLDLVQRYSGVAGRKPALDRLGGPGWERVKSRVRKAVESMARELLDLYARREAARGNAFGTDTAWQEELESAFPYELTPDQERALGEMKTDMESERTMDRLLVGDVGFGKTELAVRAGFKAVMDGFQTALLTPTTVLAFQHFETFRARYAPFPVRVEMISRFRSPAEIRKVLHDLELGHVDVVRSGCRSASTCCR